MSNKEYNPTGSTNMISFWELLKRNIIEIPIIQRDYAQGRKGKTELRRSFLKDIKEALTKPQPMMLDFVYGTPNGSKFQPLDGQQRLTTLWLIHWYIALRIGAFEEANSDIAKTLANFSYSTRVSSREFCKELCSHRFERSQKNICKYIEKQTWFYNAWLQDPTIQSMMRMISGTTIKDKKRNETPANDGIEQVFGNLEDYETIWANLTLDCKINFYHIDLLGLKLSDDLYIKMNARGKQLSSFEIFKADLIGYLSFKEKEVSDRKDSVNLWSQYNDIENGFPIKLDTTWAHIFWKENVPFWKEEQEKLKETRIPFLIDSAYFGFLNRIFFNALITEKKSNANDDDEESSYMFTGAQIEAPDNHVFRYLYGPKEANSNTFHDELIEYTSFDYYCYLHEGNNAYIPEHVFDQINKVLSNLSNCSNESLIECFPERHRGNKAFLFIPRYYKEGELYKIHSITQPQRVVFFAICRYFEKGVFDKTSFSNWMRVVWNIVDFSEINTIAGMISTMRLVDMISGGCRDIYNWLKSSCKEIKNAQLLEEKEKAIRLLEPGSQNWEEKIDTAEDYFNGSIRFLYHDADNNICWDDFGQKFEKAKEILDKKDGLREEYMEDARAIRIVLSYCNNWFEQIQSRTYNDRYIFGKSFNCWTRNIFLKSYSDNTPIYASPVHHLLMGDDMNPNPLLTDFDIYRQDAYDTLINTDIIKQCYSDRNCEKYYVRWIYDNLALYPSSEGYILSMPNRDNVLAECLDAGKIELKQGSRCQTINRDTFFGWDIHFRYKDTDFEWSHNGNIYKKPENLRIINTEESRNISVSDFINRLELQTAPSVIIEQ